MKILAVMVRYRTPLYESQTLRGFRIALDLDPALSAFYKVMVWDNSPEEIANPQLPKGFVYRYSKTNLGPAGAFNGAMRYARENGHDWMLLLDQDMLVHAGFLRSLLHHRRHVEHCAEIAAIVPTVYVGDSLESPRRQLFNRRRPYPAKQSGLAPGEAVAINSGALLRVDALEQIGGFSTDFWLDYSDTYVFHQLYLRGLKVWRAADAALQHEMTVTDYDRLMTSWRYRNFSNAESAFNDLYKGPLENAAQTLRMFVRAFLQRRKLKNPEFSRIAWEQAMYRLKTPREERLQRWKADVAMHQPERASHEVRFPAA